MKLEHRVNRSGWGLRRANFARTPVLLFLALALTGCHAPGTYTAASLPPEIQSLADVPQRPADLAQLSAPTASRDIIQSGDVVEVTLITDFAKLTGTPTPLRVADDGTVMVPLIGRVTVAGLDLKDAEREIASASVARGIYRNPSITLTMKQMRSNRVTVVGAVKTPGTYELPRGAGSVMAAVVAAGGLNENAGTDVEVRHTQFPNRLPAQYTAAAPDGVVPASFEQYAQPVRFSLVSANDPRATQDLIDGDVVQVPVRVVPPIHVMGLVNKPDSFPYPLSQQLRMLDAVAMAGGCSNMLADRVTIIRRVPGPLSQAKIELSLESAKSGIDNIPLAPGDTLVVEQTPPTVVLELFKTVFRIGFSMPLF